MVTQPSIIPLNTNGTAAQKSSDRCGFQPLTYPDLLKLPAKTWLVDKLIGERDLAMLYGQPGVGKSFLAIDLILAVVLGEVWCGFAIGRPLRVAYCVGEGKSGIAARFRTAVEQKWPGREPELGNLLVLTDVPQFFSGREDAADLSHVAFTQTVATYPWPARQEGPLLDLLVIDTLNTAILGADENSSRDAALVLDAAWAMVDALGCAVLFIHHATKDARAVERGSSVFRASMDTVIKVERRAQGPVHFKYNKMKDAEPFAERTFRLVSGVGDADSAYVEPVADEPEDKASGKTSKQRRRKETRETRLLKELQDHPYQHYTTGELESKLHLKPGSARNILGPRSQEGPRNGEGGSVQREKPKPGSGHHPGAYLYYWAPA